MVATNEAVILARRVKKEPNDSMPSWKRELIGNSARIEVPLPDVYLLRNVAPLLAGLAEFIAFTARRTDLSEYMQLTSIKAEIYALNMRIRQMHGGAHKNGTYPKLKALTDAEAESVDRRLAEYLERVEKQKATK